jgi:chitodextrinase/lysophospholipase L1-like esterase
MLNSHLNLLSFKNMLRKPYYFIILFFIAFHSKAQLRILTIGESTTEAAPGYRKKLGELLQSYGASFDMVGPKNDGANNYDGNHAGYSGAPADGVQPNVERFYNTIPADVILLWEGTNDCGWASSNGDTTNMGKLVDKILELYPNAHLFVASIPPMSFTAYESAEHGRKAGVAQANGVIYNQRLPILVQKRKEKGKKIHYVDATSLTLEDISSDGIHPNQQGHDKMANFWFQAMKTTVLDTEKPSTPSNLNASNIQKNSFTLNWNASTDNRGIALYNIYKDEVLMNTSNTTSIVISGLGSGKSYNFVVEAKDISGNLSTKSSVLKITTSGSPDNQNPTAPSSLQATVVAASSITIAWNASSDNDIIGFYEVYLNNQLTSTIPAETRTAVINKLLPGLSYNIKLRALDASGNFSVFSNSIDVRTLEGAVKFEAEQASLAGGAKVNNNHNGFSGTGFVDKMESLGAKVSFKVAVAEAGDYIIKLKYANSMGSDRKLSVLVNGGKILTTTLPSMTSWGTWGEKSELLPLLAGENTVTYAYETGDNGFVNIDFIEISKSNPTNLQREFRTQVELFPNPSKGWIWIKTSNWSNTQLSIYNQSGVLEYENQFSNLIDQKIDLPSTLKQGIYFVQLKSAEQIYTSKLLVE